MRKNKRYYPLLLVNLIIKCIPLLFIIIGFTLISSQLITENQCESPVLSEMTWAKYKNSRNILFSSFRTPPCLTNEWTIKDIKNDFEKENAVWKGNKKDVFRISSVTEMQCDPSTGKGIIHVDNEVFEVTKNNRCLFEGMLSNYNPSVFEEYLKLKSKKPQCTCKIPE